jgi:hypothetical protein
VEERSRREHLRGHWRHEFFGLRVEIPKNFIGSPTAEEFDEVDRNIAFHQCRGRAQTAEGTNRGIDVQFKEGSAKTKG